MTPQNDILIVGAGPVGLALAGDLGLRGMHVTLIDQSDGHVEQPRMDMVSARTMEFCRRWGIAGRVQQSPYPRDLAQDFVYVTSVTGYSLGRIQMPSMHDSRPPPYSPQHRERCPQNMFDPILRRFATAQGSVTLDYGVRFLTYREAAHGIIAEVEDVAAGTNRSIEARFLVGCDGAGSTVRTQSGIGTEGSGPLTYSINVLVRFRDLDSLHRYGPLYRFVFVGNEGVWATMVAIDGHDVWRLQVVGQDRPQTAEDAMVRDHVRRAVGTDCDYEILSVMPWTRREMVASSYRRGRVFLAGDAAHQMSPTGGFGMNTGIGDAVDLSWKLSGVLDGWGGDGLLASYQAERKPVAQRNAREASTNLRRMLTPRPRHPITEDTVAAAAERDRLGRELVETMSREWFADGIHFGYRYDHSPICWPDRKAPPESEPTRYAQEACPGARAPHAWLADGSSTLDLFGNGFVLMVMDGDPEVGAELRMAADRAGVPFRTEMIAEPAVVDAYGRGKVLVRPDGHVAWRGTTLPVPPSSLIERVRGADQTAQRAAAEARIA